MSNKARVSAELRYKGRRFIKTKKIRKSWDRKKASDFVIRAMNRAGMRPKQLAEYAQIDERRIHKIIDENASMTVVEFMNIMDILGVEVIFADKDFLLNW